jgi:YHS domain-containing protein
MQVDRAKALSKRSAGRTLYFCSEHCRRAFETGDARG